MLHFMNGILNTLEAANQILQKRDGGFCQSMPVIEAVFETLEHFRFEDSFDHFMEETQQTLNNNYHEDQDIQRPSSCRGNS